MYFSNKHGICCLISCGVLLAKSVKEAVADSNSKIMRSGMCGIIREEALSSQELK